MDFSELKVEFYARGTDNLSEDGPGVVRAERWLNQAYREICNLHPWPFLHATTSGTGGEVSIPDVRRIIYVTDVEGNYLQPTTIEQLVNSDGVTNLSTTGTPDYWYLDNTILKTFPVGDSINVRYIKRVGPLTGTDVPLFDEEYHTLIVDRAMIKAYQDSDNFEAAAALREEFNSEVQAMVEDYQVYTADLFFIDPYGTDM